MKHLEKLKEILEYQLALNAEELAAITRESVLTEIGADSLDFVEIVMAIEEEYTIQIDEKLAQQTFHTVGAILDYLEAHC